MKIKQAAQAAGLTEKAIRLYEEKDLIRPDTRVVAGRVFRDYPPETVEELRRIGILRRAGFSLRQIGEMDQATPESFARVLAEYRAALRAEIEQRQAIALALEHAAPKTRDELARVLEEPSAHLPVPEEDLRFAPPEPNAPARLSFWYRHGVFPHRLGGVDLAVTALLWERSLDVSAIARLLREKGADLPGDALARRLAKLARRGVLRTEGDAYTANVRAGHFCTWDPDDLVRILVNRGSDRMFYSADAPMSVSSSPGSGTHI